MLGRERAPEFGHLTLRCCGVAKYQLWNCMPLYVDFKITEGTAELHSIQFNVVMRDWPWPLFECTRWAGDSPLTLTEKEESSERTNERTNERTAETIQHFPRNSSRNSRQPSTTQKNCARAARPPHSLTHSLTVRPKQASKPDWQTDCRICHNTLHP